MAFKRSGVVSVDFRTNHQKFVQGMNQINGKMERAAKQFKVLAGAAASFVATGAFARMTRGAISSAAALQDTADRIGLTTRELQVLQEAVRQTGGNADQVGINFQRFARRLGEARTKGSGPLNDELQRLGISLNDASGNARRSFDVFLELSDKIKNTSDTTKQLAVTMAAVDTDGVKNMLPALKLGSEEIQRMGDEAEATGGLLESDLTQASRRLDTQLSVLADRMDKQLTRALISLAPIIEKIANNFGNLSVHVADATRAVTDFLGITEAPLKKQIDEVRAGIIETREEIERLEGRSGRRRGAGIRNQQLAEARQRLQDLTMQERELMTQVGQEAAEFRVQDRMRQEPLELPNETVFGKTDRERDKERRESSRAAASAAREKEQAATEAAREMAQEQERITSELQKAESLRFKIMADEFAEMNRRKAEELEKLRGVADQVGQTMGDMFISAIEGGGNFRDTLANILKDMARMVASNAFRQLAGTLFGVGGGGQGGAGGGGQVGGLFGGFDVGGFVSGLFGFANGGSFTVGRQNSTSVGGTGIDSQVVAFRARPGENVTVTPPGQEDMGRSPTVIMNNDFSSANPATIALLRQESNAIVQRAVAAVNASATRGGRTSKTVGARL